ncbi:MAG: rod shape-determining protein MreC [Flavobacteriaceae bacterium]|nr:rod shape-determining protein MreC [Flavobacteriaceae bacterium]
MQQIISFLFKRQVELLYLLLLLISLTLSINSHSYHKRQYLNSANALSSGLQQWSSEASTYFDLKKVNNVLNEENIALKNELEQLKSSIQQLNRAALNTAFGENQFKYYSAKIIKNSISRYRNYLTIDIGANDEVTADMGVINEDGIVGVVDEVSAQYATIASVAHADVQINAKLKNSDHFGFLSWDGIDYTLFNLFDVPKNAAVAIGDTIVTGGMSNIFPEEILIGTVVDYNIPNNQSFYEIKVKLSNDLANLNYVKLINNKNKNEISTLQSKTAIE